VPSDLAQAMRDAKASAAPEAMASYDDRAATAADAKATEYRSLALNQQRLALTGSSQFLSDGHYRQLKQYSQRFAAADTASAETQRQRAQAPPQKPP
jgi:hypothetical protein